MDFALLTKNSNDEKSCLSLPQYYHAVKHKAVFSKLASLGFTTKSDRKLGKEARRFQPGDTTRNQGKNGSHFTRNILPHSDTLNELPVVGTAVQYSIAG